ncbi:nuclear transport factor 2 family protein [Phreatobacter stygius]|uniref:Nuclear transport factor 2 family protein n=1 Tax=Phreatobacter stygius TaxID=1940610 RepID=A0A4D7BBC8_9HYPH|nr:nuclear transport factor 2 family protein [Phreatobacter stygius]QCI65412.1 nuclear transport factor 2 family protein [Phreatobacter stygius]
MSVLNDAYDDHLRNANLAVVQRYCAAWLAGDRQALAGCYHDDFTLHYGGANPFSGIHAGKPAALKVLAEVSRRTNRKLLAIVDCLAGPNRAVVIAREAFERGALRAELERTLVYTIRDDRLDTCWVFDVDQALVDRFLADG